MRALRYHGVKDLRVDHDVPEPPCLPHQIKVRPAFCGICGTDLHEYSSPTFTPLTPHPVTSDSVPIVVGHEFSGEILEIGSAVQNSGTDLKIGDKVAVQPTVCCNQCPPCNEGLINCCDHAGFVGLSGGGGGMSDAVCVEAKFVFKLPEHIGLDVGALVEPLSIAWHAVDRTTIQPGNNFLVMGAGPIGLAAILCLKARVAMQIIVVEMAGERQRFAKQFGATTVLDPREDDIVQKCKELCPGGGPEIALDCAGVQASIKTAAQAIRHRGQVVNVAIWEKETAFHFNNLVFGEKQISGVLGYSGKDYQGVIDALENGSLKPEGMITRTIRMDRVVEDGFAALINEKDKHVKILVDCRAE